jgi:hypothetical protein
MHKSTIGLDCMHDLPVPIRQALYLKAITSTIKPEINGGN